MSAGVIAASYVDGPGDLIDFLTSQYYWPLSETSGTVADDVKGSLDGTYEGTHTKGQASLVSDGSPSVLFTDGRVVTPNVVLGGSTGAIMAVVRPNTLGNDYMTIAGVEGGDSAWDAFLLRQDRANLVVISGSSIGAHYDHVAYNVFSTSRPVFVVARRSATFMDLFVNGLKAQSPLPVTANINTDNRAIGIGKRGTQNDRPYVGRIQHVGIWKGATPTDTEIADIASSFGLLYTIPAGFTGAKLYDTFTRIASVIGDTDFPGGSWTVTQGSFGTDGVSLYSTPSVESRAYVQVGASPYRIKFTVGDSATAFGIFFRWNTGGEGWLFNCVNQVLYTMNGGSFFGKTADLGAAAAGSVFEIDVYANGDTVIRRNGVQIISYNENWHLGDSYVGVRFEGYGGPRLSDFAVYPLP